MWQCRKKGEDYAGLRRAKGGVQDPQLHLLQLGALYDHITAVVALPAACTVGTVALLVVFADGGRLAVCQVM